MDRRVLDYLERKMRNERRRSRKDTEDYEDYEDGADYEDGTDSRRGVRGSGRGRRGRRGSRRDRRDYAGYDDYEDYEDGADYEDGHRPIKLTKADMHHWKSNMENFDGSKGEHFDMQQIMHAAEKAKVNFNDYSEKEFCLVANLMYSDFCRSIKKHIPSDEVLSMCVDMAKDFMDDPDAPEPSEKIAMYYHCIANA